MEYDKLMSAAKIADLIDKYNAGSVAWSRSDVTRLFDTIYALAALSNATREDLLELVNAASEALGAVNPIAGEKELAALGETLERVEKNHENR